jgi:hypothetical protein
MNIGNGGLALRRKSKMIEIIDKTEYNGENEDMYFARGCKEVGCNIADVEKLKEFSNETILTEHSFGVHKVWGYYNDDELNEKYKNCPEIREVKNLN